ncbi:MAG TPA: ATP-binding protein, partial [Desulfatiglandales bacterium]|nr:ATP-binding protein [Desulfatiglandales bacterium]
MINHVLLIGKTGDLSKRLSTEHQDEIGILIKELNRMLEKLEMQRFELTRVNEDLRDDIAKRKQAEKSLLESEEKLSRLKRMEALGLLAGGVAHDLNNILSGLVSYPELLLLEDDLSEKYRKPIEAIQVSGLKAAKIVDDLLTIARGVAISKEVININDIVNKYMLSPEYEKLIQYHPSVMIKAYLDPELLNVKGSPVHIGKVVMNLVSNAAEAMQKDGIVAISTMNQYLDRPVKGYDWVNIGEYAVLSVSDEGPGISKEDLERIFEPFYTKKVLGRSGTGLGLAVVWNTVQDHRGYIDVETSEKGTTFRLYFPITRDRAVEKESEMAIEELKGRGQTILVVDDEESQREIAFQILTMLGYKVETVASGEEAIEYLKEHKVDLILLDMIMDPGINGRETYEMIIKIHPNQKAIIASGFSETEEVKKAQQLGAG